MAKLDLMVVKNHSFSAVFEDKANHDLDSHLDCNMGQWYAGEGKRVFGNTNDFKISRFAVEEAKSYLASKIRLIKLVTLISTLI